MISVSLECGASLEVTGSTGVFCSGKKCLEVEGNIISAVGFKSVDEVLDVIDTIKQLMVVDKQ